MVVFWYSIIFAFIQSYATFYNLFPNFSFGLFPEGFVVVSFVLLGSMIKLRDVIFISIISPVLSFGLLQLIGYIFFREYTTHNILLTVLAKGAVGFGMAWLLVGIVVGSISNLIFSKGNGKKVY
ncbi:hypothetical protein [Fervidobacterium sp.]